MRLFLPKEMTFRDLVKHRLIICVATVHMGEVVLLVEPSSRLQKHFEKVVTVDFKQHPAGKVGTWSQAVST